MKKLDQLNTNDPRISKELPKGFDNRFLAKLDKANGKDHSPIRTTNVPSFLDSLKIALLPAAFALSLAIVVINISKAPISLESQLETIVYDLEVDIEPLGAEQWDLLFQLAEN